MKRFRDTEIWRKRWFRQLSPAEKCAWDLITAECDNVGLWSPDFEAADFYIGSAVDWEMLPEKVNGNVQVLDSGKWWLPDFCLFQHPDLDPESSSMPILSYVKLLRKHGLWEAYLERKETLSNGQAIEAESAPISPEPPDPKGTVRARVPSGEPIHRFQGKGKGKGKGEGSSLSLSSEGEGESEGGREAAPAVLSEPIKPGSPAAMLYARFEREYGSIMPDIGAQAKACQQLIQMGEARGDIALPGHLLDMLLEQKGGAEQFWRKQPILPKTAVSLFAQLYELIKPSQPSRDPGRMPDFKEPDEMEQLRREKIVRIDGELADEKERIREELYAKSDIVKAAQDKGPPSG